MSCFKLNASRALEVQSNLPLRSRTYRCALFHKRRTDCATPRPLPGSRRRTREVTADGPQRAPPHSVAIEEIFAHAYHRIPTTHIIDAVLRNQPIFGPCHELAQGIDLVVVLDIREGEHLCAQLVQPRGILFQQHLASFQGGLQRMRIIVALLMGLTA